MWFAKDLSQFSRQYHCYLHLLWVKVQQWEIPNNQLRVVPNRGIATLNQKAILPDNRNIQALAQRLTKITTTDVAENKNLFKTSKFIATSFSKKIDFDQPFKNALF